MERFHIDRTTSGWCGDVTWVSQGKLTLNSFAVCYTSDFKVAGSRLTSVTPDAKKLVGIDINVAISVEGG